MLVDEYRKFYRTTKVWMDYVKDDMCIKGVNNVITTDKGEQKREICWADYVKVGDKKTVKKLSDIIVLQ